jgi:RNA polymerase sigma-B factor
MTRTRTQVVSTSKELNAPVPAPGAAERLADERILLRRHAAEPSEATREELVRRFMPLAQRLARRYAGGAEPLDDLFQVASLGLVKAIDRYDPSRGTTFSTFAVPTILGELKRHFRDRGWSLRVPRSTQERTLRVDKALEELPGRLGRTPTVKDVARWLEIDEDEVLEAMHASRAHHAGSLDRPVSSEVDEGATLVDRVGGEDHAFDAVEYGVAIGPALADTSERERLILHLRFVEDLTQSEIAKRVGISQMHVSRLLRGLLDRLREEADAEPPGVDGSALAPSAGSHE